MYDEIRQALSYDAQKSDSYLDDLYLDLPVALKNELMMCVHDSALCKFTFLKRVGNRYFITWVSSQLKQRISTPGQRIYQVDDEIDDFFFMTKGVAAFIKSPNNSAIISVIDPNGNLPIKRKAKGMKTLQFFGCEDSVYNHLKTLIEVDEGRTNEI